MTNSSPDWITCGEAQRLVCEICKSASSDCEPFRSVLRMGLLGHVRVSADRAVACRWDSADELADTIDLEFDDPVDHPETNFFLQHLLHRYGNDAPGLKGFACFLTGTFEFGDDRIGDTPLLWSFYVSGLKFSRTDMVRLFGTTPTAIDRNKSKKSGGAPTKYDWEGALVHLIAVANSRDGLHPQDKVTASHLARLMGNWFSENSPDGEHPADSLLRELGRRIVAEIERLVRSGKR
ncbi:hypothetical protein [Novosphingobium sp.]|uniref:hypothetical protein n=1 Tax=Novosphingobium sp. TaxID=1874826 RepID=UPI001DDDAD8C|nr:hypothetical protein [Novosphingobium sp.]MBX9665920.1 hypothetical protein [Novosphingobium sp.]